MFLFFLNHLLSCFLSTVFLSSFVVSLNPSATLLLQFLHSLPRESQELLPWNQTQITDSSPCNLYGVYCYNTGFQVKTLNLSGLGLSGVLNDSVSYLCLHKNLISLDLSGNNFTGSIPEMFGTDCGRLSTIILKDNGFQGSIPSGIFHSGKIKKLDLGFNSLSGRIPSEVSFSSDLEYLGLYNNFLTGEIPNGLFSLPKLKFLFLNTNNLTGSLPGFSNSCGILDLYIHHNELVGSLPVTLSNCRNLTSFTASENNFRGIMPPEIFYGLSQLKFLHLDKNRIEGRIPDTLWDLANLQVLVLSDNRLNGTVSEKISQTKQLTVIALSGNELTGEIPRSIGELTALNTLYLFDNMLTGSLPSEIGNCSSLVELQLQNNYIGGTIPWEIGKLKSLEVLLLFNNQIGGFIPKQIGNMSSLTQLALYRNSLNGTIPSEITLLGKLTFLSLAHNNLIGVILPALGKNSLGLEKLDLGWNKLHGPIPSGLCTGNSLSVLVLGDNRLTGSFPNEIAECSSLTRVILSNNLLQGNILEDLNRESGITYLDARGNLLGGSIPSGFGHWYNLSMLDLSENRFSASIPSEFGQLKNLEVLRLSSNKLSGTIPSELSRCEKINKLDLSKNQLSGPVPSKILTSLVKLQIVRLQENKLDGVLPDSFASLQNLIELQLGSNSLAGRIPCSLSNLQHFSSVLNLSNNKLSGEIPGCLSKLNKLQVLDLSRNDLSGKIPRNVNGMISLDNVNISFNRLNGRIPSSWMKILASHPSSFIGNPELCLTGNDSQHCGSVGKLRKTTAKILAGLIAGVVSVIVICALICVLMTRAMKHRNYSNLILLNDYQSKTEDLPEDLKIEDLMHATEGWSDKYVIGRGKHGTVYRTESTKSQKHWAVKRVDLCETDFAVELRTLNMVRHRNVVRMTGYCVKDGFGFIVTDYMPRGTLFDVLHRGEPRPGLDWGTRYQIALGITNGLAYLHHDCVPQIIHRDIKSDNILLDPEFEPKIGDFGTAKVVDDSDETSISQSVIVGTLGYMAPENAYSTGLTEKCDVYSYGVILLEILCRKLPVDPSFEEGLDIVSRTRLNLLENEECISFLDEEISLWLSDEQHKALKLLELSLQCTEQAAEARPSMRDVVGFLLKLKNKH